MRSDKQNTQFHSESSRCLHCAKPACRVACPIGCDVPSFLQCVARGELDKATQVVGHPFGEICGYVCPHELQCQGSCVLSKRGQAVQMGMVERAVFAEQPYEVERKDNLLSGRKVAVVGGGVSGVTLAVKLYEQGADITIYEKDELLSTLKFIPDFRLPHEAIARIERSIEGKLTVVKETVTSQRLTDLLRNCDTVYLATGLSVPYALGVEGEELATPYDEFLRCNSREGSVVVIGGGNTAMDCARLAKRNGADVTVAYRRTREDMPAFDREVAEAESDGVKFRYNLAPVKLAKVNDKLQLTLAKTVSVGRGKLTVTDEFTVVECDAVVAALGGGFDKSIYGQLQVSDDARRPLPNLYVGGDAAGGNLVAQAVADGLKAAREIVAQLSNNKNTIK